VIHANGEEKPDIYDGGGEGGDAGYGDGGSDFNGWFDDVDDCMRVADKTGEDQPVVSVGTEGNGGQFAYDPPAIEVSTGTTVVWDWTGEGGYHDVAHVSSDFQSETSSSAVTPSSTRSTVRASTGTSVRPTRRSA
jgi:plastocyanin